MIICQCIFNFFFYRYTNFFLFIYFSDASRPLRKETSTTIPKNGVSSPAASLEATTSLRGKPDTGDHVTSSTPSSTGISCHEIVNKSSDSDIFKTDSKDNVSYDKDIIDDSSSESSYMSLPASVNSDLSKTENIYYDDIASLMGNRDKNLNLEEDEATKENPAVNTIPAAITCTIISKSPTNMSSDAKLSKNDHDLFTSREESRLSITNLNQKVILMYSLSYNIFKNLKLIFFLKFC